MVSFVYSPTADSDKRLICCLDQKKKNTTGADDELFVLSEYVSDHENDQLTEGETLHIL